MEIALCHPAPESFRYAPTLGCRWAYLDISWAMVQPQANVFDFSFFDERVAVAKELGLKLIGAVYSERGFSYFPDEKWIWQNARGMMPDPAAWQHYLKSVVERYKDTIQHWEMWSEPNCPACNPMSYYDPRIYREVLRLGSQAIKAADPTAKIVLGGFWFNSLNRRYLRLLLSEETTQYFDIFNWHFFLMANQPQQKAFELWQPVLSNWMDYFRSVLPENYPIWVTEFGLPTRPADSEILHSRTSGEIYGLTEEEQADWFSQFAEVAEKEWGLDLLVWLMLKDYADPNNYYISTTGMLRPDGSPKPVHERVRQFLATKRADDSGVGGG